MNIIERCMIWTVVIKGSLRLFKNILFLTYEKSSLEKRVDSSIIESPVFVKLLSIYRIVKCQNLGYE